MSLARQKQRQWRVGRIAGQRHAVRHGAAWVVRKRDVSAGENDANLLIAPGLYFDGRTQHGQKALVIGLSKQVHLLGTLRQIRSEIDPSWVLITRGGTGIDLHIDDSDEDVAERPLGRGTRCRIAHRKIDSGGAIGNHIVRTT